MALGKLKEKKGQAYATCCFRDCQEKGRVLARLGEIEIAYCGSHRKKYGERVLNALVNARFNGKLARFLSVIKQDLFMNYNSHLCEECRKKEAEYIINKTNELYILEQEADNYNLNKDNLSEECDDSEWEFEDERSE